MPRCGQIPNGEIGASSLENVDSANAYRANFLGIFYIILGKTSCGLGP